jgi:hypothetical protein
VKLTVTRLGEGRYETLIKRDDGVTFRLPGVGRKFSLPHDLAHFVVEQSLRLDHGFWGSVAAGAVFDQMLYVAGRRKPKAAERSRTVLKANAQALSEAEVLVRIFNEAFELGQGKNSAIIYAHLSQRRTPPGRKPFDLRDVERTISTWDGLLARWNELPAGGRLDLAWPR